MFINMKIHVFLLFSILMAIIAIVDASFLCRLLRRCTGTKNSAQQHITLDLSPPLDVNTGMVYQVELKCNNAKAKGKYNEGISIGTEVCHGNVCKFVVHKCPNGKYNVFVDIVSGGGNGQQEEVDRSQIAGNQWKHIFKLIGEEYKDGEAYSLSIDIPQEMIDALKIMTNLKNQQKQEPVDQQNSPTIVSTSPAPIEQNIPIIPAEKSPESANLDSQNVQEKSMHLVGGSDDDQQNDQPMPDHQETPNSMVTIKVVPPPGQEGMFMYKVWLKCYAFGNRTDFHKLKGDKQPFDVDIEGAIEPPCYGSLCPFEVFEEKKGANGGTDAVVHKCPSKIYDIFVVKKNIEKDYGGNDGDDDQEEANNPAVWWTISKILDGGEYTIRHYM